MNTYANPNSAFPSQVVPDVEKASMEYGRRVAQAIESEWWRQGGNGTRFATSYNRFHTLRLYARGEQPVQKYKDELAINGDMSYLNLDWKPVPVVSKFVDIVANGMNNKLYEIKAFAQDPISLKKRTDYATAIMQDMLAKQELMHLDQTLGLNKFQTDPEKLPESEEELEVHMQLSYKQAIEIANEEVINNTLDKNRFDNIRKRFNYDLVTLGVGAVKTQWNPTNGVTLDYVDPANLIYSYSEDPHFEDIYYVGEVKSLTIPEIAKQFPHLTEAQLENIQQTKGYNNQQLYGWQTYDQNTVQVMFFEYKTYNTQVFKIKETDTGLEKALEKPDTFDPPKNDNFKKVSRKIEVLYTGVKVLGNNELIEWKLSENMTRPFADTTKVEMSYTLCAPRMYKGRIDSIVSRITGFADMIQITHLKLQQVIARMVPDGVFLDMDGLAEVDLGNGTNYNPAEALNMYFQTGSIVGRSLTQEGDMNPGKVPIQELQTSSGGQKIASLIQTYQYYLQMIRDVTGLNEARDGSMPEQDTLVGLQKMAVNASNTATRHLMQGSLWLTLRTCENISLKVADSLKFPLTLNSLKNSISTYNTATLSEIQNLNLHDFGIFLELEPDEEDKAILENNIQMALQQQSIDLEDAIDIRRIKNIKLANDVLKQKRKKKAKQEQQNQMQIAQAQEQAKVAADQAKAEAEMQKQQALKAAEVEFEKAKSAFDIQKLQAESQIKQQEMQIQHQYDMELKRMEVEAMQEKENRIEDRKDKRTQMEGTQQSEMIDQRNNDLMPIDFEKRNSGVQPSI
jgi:regulator of protease activity HflC (stomatin/prohibitin superfamily)